MLQLTSPSVSLPKQLGNLYTGSLYSALLSVLATEPLALVRTKSLIASECDSNHKREGREDILVLLRLRMYFFCISSGSQKVTLPSESSFVRVG